MNGSGGRAKVVGVGLQPTQSRLMSNQVQNLAAVFFLSFGLAASFDGVYLHLWRYRLFAYSETRREHVLHMLRGVLFPLIIYLLLAAPAVGLLLWIAALLAALDLFLQGWDLWEERRARRGFGGLSTFEYSLHVWLAGLHLSGLTLTLAARPLSAWSLAAGQEAAVFAEYAAGVAWFLLPGSIGGVLLHLGLLHPYFYKGERPPEEMNRMLVRGLAPLI